MVCLTFRCSVFHYHCRRCALPMDQTVYFLNPLYNDIRYGHNLNTAESRQMKQRQYWCVYNKRKKILQYKINMDIENQSDTSSLLGAEYFDTLGPKWNILHFTDDRSKCVSWQRTFTFDKKNHQRLCDAKEAKIIYLKTMITLFPDTQKRCPKVQKLQPHYSVRVENIYYIDWINPIGWLWIISILGYFAPSYGN